MVLELGKLEYLKKWYIAIYFPNSVSGLNILKINTNGPKSPIILSVTVGFDNVFLISKFDAWASRKSKSFMLFAIDTLGWAFSSLAFSADRLA